MSIQVKHNCVSFKNLTESLEYTDKHGDDAILSALFEATKTEASAFVNFGEVARVNSSGLLSWVKALQRFPKPVIYTKAPEWLVGFFNERKKEFLKNATVESFYAPFFNSELTQTESVLLQVDEEIPSNLDVTLISNLKLSRKNTKGQAIEPDFELEDYLFFLINSSES